MSFLSCIILTRMSWICRYIMHLLTLLRFLIVLLYHILFTTHLYLLPHLDPDLTLKLLLLGHYSLYLLCLVEMNTTLPLRPTTPLTSLLPLSSILKLIHHLIPLSMLNNFLAVVSIGLMMHNREMKSVELIFFLFL